MYKISIQTKDFKTEDILQHIQTHTTGAICSFIGVVRGEETLALEVEHYPQMTEKAIETIVKQATKRFAITATYVIHRTGYLKKAEKIVLVAIAAPHRHAAFQACQFIMDYIKTQAPFWKKEYKTNGDVYWIETRRSDDEALKQWISTENRSS
jgi:molybdopterin synthase catalytic subunit